MAKDGRRLHGRLARAANAKKPTRRGLRRCKGPPLRSDIGGPGIEFGGIWRTTIADSALTLVLLDIRMPDGDGLTALGRIKLDKPKLPVLLFSAFDNLASVARAVAIGASGFLLKGCTRNEFLNAIRVVAAGENIWSRGWLLRAGCSSRTPPLGTLEASLAEREGEVLRQIANGLNNEQIAEAMNVSCVTVKVHVRRILRKLGLTDRTQAAVWVVRNGLV
jgi:DNA-binding NarL/FixJ family response regulator